MEKKNMELYVHIPFCQQKCLYCDFLSAPADEKTQTRYVQTLIKEIKSLQQQSVELEYKGDLKYKEIDKEIEIKVKHLNNKPIYQEYLRRMDQFNDILSQSSSTIEKYINTKI